MFCYGMASFMKLFFPWVCHCWLVHFFTLKHYYFLGTYFTVGRVLFSWVSHLEDSRSIPVLLPVESFFPPRFLEPRLTYDTDWFVSCLCSKSPNTSYCLKSKCFVTMAYKAFSLYNKYLNTNEDHESLLRLVRLTQQSNEKEAGA